ncbi:MAG: arginase family protein [Gammaproteobacteria bacterium]|nr:arginase family protein [Gammaproteobacteria bacterium]
MASTQAVTLIETIGVASCLGGSQDSCDIAPYVIRASPFQQLLTDNNLALHWQQIVAPAYDAPNSLPCLARISKEIACLTYKHTLEHFSGHSTGEQTGKPFLLLSGDHSSAIGTWCGVMSALAHSDKKLKTLGLIWLDAHLDAHTLETSPSGNLHGMPLSVLLGKADKKLQATYPDAALEQHTGCGHLSGNNLSLLGVRSYEAEELALLGQVNAKIYSMDALQNNSAPEQWLNHIAKDLLTRCDVIGISLDMDAINPEDAPAVETPEEHGISGALLIAMLKQFSCREKLVGFEISEFNPVNDINHRTEKLLMQIICAMFDK